MKTYNKINTIFKRDMSKPNHPLIEGDWSEEEFEYLQNCMWCGTEKVDGTNTRVQFDGKEVYYKGKTDNAQYFPGMLEKLKELFPIEKMIETFPEKEGIAPQICLYGEMYGKGIQSVGKIYNALGVNFILFDIKIGEWWLKRQDVENIAEQLEVNIVPIVFNGTLNEAIVIIKQGFRSTVSVAALNAEGMILFPETQLFNRKGERIITKLKQKDFAL